MGRTPDEESELAGLMQALGELLHGHDTTVVLAALNYTMGQLIRDCYDGDERALRLSDEQTRFVARELEDDGKAN